MNRSKKKKICDWLKNNGYKFPKFGKLKINTSDKDNKVLLSCQAILTVEKNKIPEVNQAGKIEKFHTETRQVLLCLGNPPKAILNENDPAVINIKINNEKSNDWYLVCVYSNKTIMTDQNPLGYLFKLAPINKDLPSDFNPKTKLEGSWIEIYDEEGV